MKNLNLLLLAIFLLSSCTSNVLPPTITAASKSLPTQTSTLTPTATYTPQPTNTSVPTITPTSLPITFVYEDTVPASGRKLQEQAAYKAYTYYSQYADLGPITIYTFEDITKYIDQIFPTLHADNPYQSKSSFVNEWIAGGGGNTAAKDIVAISSNYLAWTDTNNKCYKSKNVAHEMFHLEQSRLLRYGLFRQALDYGPEWLKEGSAEVFGHKVADGLNGCSYADQLMLWISNSTTANYQLKAIDGGDFSNKMQFWSLAPFAVDSLIQLAPNGENSVIDFYTEIGNGKPWHEAFQTAFGMSVEDFYSSFDATRAKHGIDTSVCIAQTDARVKCLGVKPNKDYIFSIPDSVFVSNTDKWKVDSKCEITGWGMEGSQGAWILQISVTDNTHGPCTVKVAFSKDQQITVDFVVP